ncbi:hypothetical protein [Burkholderia plantarii]|nr:hypothetical protein [Burkholderia plantarii]
MCTSRRIAVSYTHLDVYKRQVFALPDVHVTPNSCLLYTSRCV